MKYINLTPAKFLSLMFSFYFIVNTTLYFMRENYDGWWVGDFKVYDGVDTNLNTIAFMCFIFYLFVFFLFLALFCRKNRYTNIRMELKYPSYILFLLFLFQIVAASVFNIGKASSTGETSNPLFYLMFLFSFDAAYYVYAVVEKNNKRLYLITAMFAFSNIVRGWAGFIIPLILIYLTRRKKIRTSYLLMIMVICVLCIPLLLTLRAYYRGGETSYLEGDVDGNYYFSYVILSLKILLSRFDLYSHFIGVSSLPKNEIVNVMCMPFQENIINKIFLRMGFSNECLSLGSILPASLYDFFIGKGTSFSIGSAFFALPADKVVIFAVTYLCVIIFSFFIVSVFCRSDDLSIVLLFLMTFLLFQGWMYQYVYNLLGYVFGCFLAFSTLRVQRKNE